MHRRPLSLACLTVILLAPMAEAQQDGITDFMFQRLDSDASGDISQAEIAAAKERQFAGADSDSDGRVTEAELAAVRERLARFARIGGDVLSERAMRLDRDGDRAVSLAEYTAASPFFALVDVDGDGALSRAELDRARAALSPQP
ncbi:hypothetical protein [Tabrizicola sp.]|uniref:EF-hand domain-containing protein n=1 Tax=Tabrizicola sp. TaxID=2005166 RepID=UPI00286AF94B|nr:hypothetical protein [Tabrizicola sp.]